MCLRFSREVWQKIRLFSTSSCFYPFCICIWGQPKVARRLPNDPHKAWQSDPTTDDQNLPQSSIIRQVLLVLSLLPSARLNANTDGEEIQTQIHVMSQTDYDTIILIFHMVQMQFKAFPKGKLSNQLLLTVGGSSLELRKYFLFLQI